MLQKYLSAAGLEHGRYSNPSPAELMFVGGDWNLILYPVLQPPNAVCERYLSKATIVVKFHPGFHPLMFKICNSPRFKKTLQFHCTYLLYLIQSETKEHSIVQNHNMNKTSGSLHYYSTQGCFLWRHQRINSLDWLENIHIIESQLHVFLVIYNYSSARTHLRHFFHVWPSVVHNICSLFRQNEIL